MSRRGTLLWAHEEAPAASSRQEQDVARFGRVGGPWRLRGQGDLKALNACCSPGRPLLASNLFPPLLRARRRPPAAGVIACAC